MNHVITRPKPLIAQQLIRAIRFESTYRRGKIVITSKVGCGGGELGHVEVDVGAGLEVGSGEGYEAADRILKPRSASLNTCPSRTLSRHMPTHKVPMLYTSLSIHVDHPLAALDLRSKRLFRRRIGTEARPYRFPLKLDEGVQQVLPVIAVVQDAIVLQEASIGMDPIGLRYALQGDHSHCPLERILQYRLIVGVKAHADRVLHYIDGVGAGEIS
jgi:hypothetical protein